MQNLKKIVDRVALLDKFAAEVAKKHFDKVPYAIWRKMAHMNDVYVGISYMIDKASFKMYTIDMVGSAVDIIAEFSSQDHSFGAFMNLHWDEITPVGGQTVYNNSAITNATSSNFYYDYNEQSTITTAGNSYVWTTTGTDYNNNWQDTAIAYNHIPTENDVRRICKEVINEKKENKKMDTSNLFNFDFGPASSNQFRMSPYGLAVRTQANGWVAYNAKTGDLMDVDILNFDISKMIYKMPVALTAIKPGDILIHGGKPVFVREVATGGNTVRVIDYTNATVADILPVKSPFGFNFFTKVCPLFNFDQASANSDNPFGNMLPFLMLNGEKDGSFDPTLLFMASAMNGGNMDFASNPMMLYCLMSRQDKGDILPFLMMMNGGVPGLTQTQSGTPIVTATT